MSEPGVRNDGVSQAEIEKETLAMVRINRMDLEEKLARMGILFRRETGRGDHLMNRLEKMRDVFCAMRVYIRKTHKKCQKKKTCDTCQGLARCETILKEFRWE